MSIPPNTVTAFMTMSDSMIAFLKSKSIPPNIAVRSAPLKGSSLILIVSPENITQCER